MSTLKKTPILTSDAPAAIGPYSQAILAGNTLYCSGQIPLVPGTSVFVEGGFKEQAEQVFKNLEAVCKAANTDLNSIVKLTVYITDMSNFAVLNTVMESVFTAPFPARTTIPVQELPRGALVEIDAIVLVH
jgi:2-iminobutanoate/2-iminopropanoate deaminase